jgi:hypothetical protein
MNYLLLLVCSLGELPCGAPQTRDPQIPPTVYAGDMPTLESAGTRRNSPAPLRNFCSNALAARSFCAITS